MFFGAAAVTLFPIYSVNSSAEKEGALTGEIVGEKSYDVDSV